MTVAPGGAAVQSIRGVAPHRAGRRSLADAVRRLGVHSKGPVRLYHSLMAKHLLRKLMSLWPPFLGAGIRVKRINRDFTEVDVEMTLRVWNQNYVGVHFGGSLYAMTDPFYMLMLMENLGREYIVWDKAATVRFKRPGRGRVRAAFRITREQIDTIRAQADREAKVEPVFQVRVIDGEGTLVAEVEKTLYVRRKDRIPQPAVSVEAN